MTRVLIADDHPLMLSGIEAILRTSSYELVAKADDGQAAIAAIAKTQPDVLILDVQMPCGGLHVLRALRSQGDMRPIILLTASLDDHSLVEALQLGVQGIILKDGAQHLLLQCLDEVQKGGRWIDKAVLQRAVDLTMGGSEQRSSGLERLSAREKEIAELVAQGMRNRQIAEELHITEGTVKVYLHRTYEKLNVGSRTELAILLKESGPT